MIYLFVSQNMFNFAPANKINDDNEAESESTHY